VLIPQREEGLGNRRPIPRTTPTAANVTPHCVKPLA
jgi:hypothetical protein